MLIIQVQWAIIGGKKEAQGELYSLLESVLEPKKSTHP